MKKNGYTLVEILVSISLLLLIGTVFFQFFTFSQKTTSRNEDKLVSINLAQSVLEEIKSSKWNVSDENANKNYLDIIKGSSKEPYNYKSCINDYDKKTCENLFKKKINGRTYDIEIYVDNKNEVGLYPVEIKIYSNGQLQSSLKGLIE